MSEKMYVSDVPALMAQWGDNPDLDPHKVSAVSKSITANWICHKCGYTWSSSVKGRYVANGKCPCCDSNKVIRKGVNDVFTMVPGLKKYYDFKKNADVDICSLGLDSSVKIWRKCPECGREWQTALRSCIRKVNGAYEAAECPHYNTVKRKAEDVPSVKEIDALSRFYDEGKNELPASDVRSNSEKPVWWKCKECGHEWSGSPRAQSRSSGKCPCCELGLVTRKGVNDLFTLIPEAKAYYDFEANGDFDIYSHPIRNTETGLHWQCPDCGYKWVSPVANRIRGIRGSYKWSGCRQCYQNGTSRITSVSSKSYLVKRWDFKKNTDKDISLTSAYQEKPAFWHCKNCGYEWSETIKSMNEKRGTCPFCERKTAVMTGRNDALTVVSGLAEFMDPEHDYAKLHTVGPMSKAVFPWKCPQCDRKWYSPLDKRVRRTENGSFALIGCSACGYHAFRQETYDKQYPVLAQMYDEELNEKPMSEIFGKDDHKKKFYWNCPDCGETFSSLLSSMKQSIKNGTTGCPYCSHTLVRKGESFADVHPEYMDEYDPDNSTDPFAVHPNRKESVSWICRNNKEHRWNATFALRNAGGGNCPVCNHSYVVPEVNSFAAVYPECVSLWAPSNERSAQDTFFDSSLWLRWLCPDCGKEYGAYIKDVMSEEESCPYCANRKVDPDRNSLQALYPEVTLTWSQGNDTSPDHVFPDSKTWAKWDCPDCGGSYNARVADMVNEEAACPYCKGRLVLPGFNSFADKHKELCHLWSVENDKSPDEVLEMSSTIYKWDCPDCGGTFNAAPRDIISGVADCPYCNDRLVLPGFNSFAARHKDLMENEYNYAANCLLIDPDQVSDSCTIPIWWNCRKNPNHHYHISIADRLMYEKRHREPCRECKGLRRKKSHFVRYTKKDVE